MVRGYRYVGPAQLRPTWAWAATASKQGWGKP
jgi:hypothetical protein